MMGWKYFQMIGRRNIIQKSSLKWWFHVGKNISENYILNNLFLRVIWLKG